MKITRESSANQIPAQPPTTTGFLETGSPPRPPRHRSTDSPSGEQVASGQQRRSRLYNTDI